VSDVVASVKGPAGGHVRSADRALQILLLMGDHESVEWSLNEIAHGVGLAKSTTHRILETLIGRGFVEPGAGRGTYRLGLRAAVVGHAALRARTPPAEIHQVLAQLSASVRESAGLSVLDGDQVVVVDRALSQRALQWNLTVGASIPASQSAAGKVLLSQFSDDQVRRDHPGPGFLRALDRVRRDGYALDDEEFDPGLRCIAVPVRSISGRATHALAIAAPASRWSLDALRTTVPMLRRAASAMSPLLYAP
jgi:IclR family KDG regulon transcriptional repressor